MLPMLFLIGLVRPEAIAAVSLEVVSAGSRDQPVVALTFDDGTDPANTQAIFAILQSAGVAATFFPFGNTMRADPTFWPQVVAAGYPIGNHSMTHPVLTGLSDAALHSEINDATALITQLSGQPPISFMRPPYGAPGISAWRPRRQPADTAGCCCGTSTPRLGRSVRTDDRGPGGGRRPRRLCRPAAHLPRPRPGSCCRASSPACGHAASGS
jgi:peptidoglycan/xylan/chitin deacetylase (PgdA/CDA1 family)